MERWFALISQRAIRRGSFRSVKELVDKIDAFAQHDKAVISTGTGELKRCMLLLSVTEVFSLSKPTDLLQGTLDLLILKTIALKPMHGWAVAQRIRQMSGEVLQVGQGALYPSLHKLEQNGWISSEWAVSETGRRAKYYTLTRAGSKALKQEAAQWERLSGAVSLIVRTV